MESTKSIFSKWIIEGLEGFVFGSNKELYRLPFVSHPNNYGLRRITKQKGGRWKLDGVWWSQKQLKPKLKINPQPAILVELGFICPF